MTDLDEYAKAEAAEWGTWVAKEDINFGLVLAYKKGDPVPVVNVEAYGYDKQGLVERVAKPSAEKKA